MQTNFLARIKLGLLNRMSQLHARAVDTETSPADAHSLVSLGNKAVQTGDVVAAEAHYRQALALQPQDRGTLVNLGFVLKEQRRWAEARVFLQRAIALQPDDPDGFEAHYLFGLVAEEEGNLPDAVIGFGKAFALKPDFELACRDLCRTLFLTHKMAEAQSVLDKGLALNPDYPWFHFYQGNLHLENQNPDRAIASYQKAITSGADDATVHSALGILLYRLNRKDEALQHLQRAETLEPGCIVNAQYESGSRFLLLGDGPSAIANFELAITLEPSHLAAHSKLLFCLSFNPGCSPGYEQAAHRFGAILNERAGNRQAPGRIGYTPGNRPLRVGFVSGDFKAHPVGFFLEGILTAMDRQRVHCISYSNTSIKDHHTEKLEHQFGEWHDIHGLGDGEVDAMVRQHQIDILVDLSGHTGENRLPVFAGRPAPVQVSWLGYFASTGLAEIDFILADRFSVPDHSTEYFAEKIFYLPETRLCLTPPRLSRPVDVAQPPAIVNGYVTFGSYQPLVKINVTVLTAWKSLLDRVPHSRLRLQTPKADVPAVRSELLRRLGDAGIDASRVTISPGTHWEEYLSSYNQVDMLLDTFPYPGGTTTAEALWMGVPTVTIRGETMLSRQGAAMLHCVGLDEWIATSQEEYVAKAVQFSGDLPALVTLRAELRERALQSPLFDSQRFAGHLADAFEWMMTAPGNQHLSAP